MSPNWSVSRNMLPCLRTWTLPRSVAFSMGPTRGSRKRTADAGSLEVTVAGGGGAAATRGWVSRAIVGSADVRQPIGLIGHDEGIDQPIEVAVHDPRQGRQVELDPVV